MDALLRSGPAISMINTPDNRSRKMVLRPLIVVVVAGMVLWWGRWSQRHTTETVQTQIDASLTDSTDALSFSDERVRAMFVQGVQKLRGHDVMAPLRIRDVHPDTMGDNLYTARLVASNGDSIGLIIQYTADEQAVVAGVDLEPATAEEKP